MQVFYAPDITGDIYSLDENESRHIVRVLRMTKGTPVRLIDGRGNLYDGIISEPDQRRCLISITGVTHDFGKRPYRLHLAVSPLKNADRFEWLIEKSTEIGIDEISPLICRNTEKTSVRADRLNNIIISAMKQSLKTIRPRLNDPVTYDDFVLTGEPSLKLIAHCNNSFERFGIKDVCTPGTDAIIMIGPEGDFSEEEIRKAVAEGFVPVHLGDSRLRTETAGIAACFSVYFINQ